MTSAAPEQDLTESPLFPNLGGHDSAATIASVENPCPHCGAPRTDSHQVVCKRCGYYEKLGICVDLDATEREGQQAAPAPGPKHWWTLVPFWAWIVGAGGIVIVAESVAARFLTEPGSLARTIWSLTQLFVGGTVFVAVHVSAYLYAIMEDDRLQVLDIVLKPIAVWERTINSLPETWRRVAAGAWGWLAATLAVSLIGGIPYHKLFDWGIKERPKQNLVQAIVDEARQAEGGADSLDEAVNDFTGAAEPEEEPLKTLRPLDCLVLGYVPEVDRDGMRVVDIRSLLLAAEVKGKLRYVGRVSVAEMPPPERFELLRRMQPVERDRPLVRCDQVARWLEPKFSCRVRFKSWTSADKLNGPRFEKMLSDLELPLKP